jgi:TPR repeat protein
MSRNGYAYNFDRDRFHPSWKPGDFHMHHQADPYRFPLSIMIMFLSNEKVWYFKMNTNEDIERFRKLAETGDADAQYHLGLIYQNEKGVSLDYAQAVKWL